ncbi:MAG: SPFH domain-containing protein [Prevotella sp.]|nr:SPFH domain-containing protein [Prevotella sp.]MBP3827659.1 SPFH domain-containing protein [Prevotella sp.]
MGFFSRGKSGGIMNVIRCDEQEYLVWKWRPEGQSANSTSRENSIRWGSSLRVKDGEVAVFVYKQKDGSNQDFIEGPFDDTIKTANFPVLSNIIGLAYGGDTPFQAEVYFINLQGNNQMRFAVPYFDVFDPRLPDHGVPMAVRGTITFNITDYRGFIKLNRLINFELDDFLRQIKSAVTKYVKGVVMNIPQEMGIPVVQMERQILQINDRIQGYLKPRIEGDFGVNLKALDIAAMEIDKESPYYEELRQLTAGNTARTMNAQTDVNIQNLKDTQKINAENMAETLRIQREEMQRAQKLQTETNFIGAHALNQQTDVLKTGAQSLGQMGSMDMGTNGGGMNPAGMMTGMMMGGAMGQQMAGMMQNMGQQMQGAMNTPPPMPNIQYHVSVNGAQAGPFNMQQLQQMAQSGQLTPQTYVWKQGMVNWEFAGNVPELVTLFAPPAPGATPPPPPPAL